MGREDDKGRERGWMRREGERGRGGGREGNDRSVRGWMEREEERGGREEIVGEKEGERERERGDRGGRPRERDEGIASRNVDQLRQTNMNYYQLQAFENNEGACDQQFTFLQLQHHWHLLSAILLHLHS